MESEIDNTKLLGLLRVPFIVRQAKISLLSVSNAPYFPWHGNT